MNYKFVKTFLKSYFIKKIFIFAKPKCFKIMMQDWLVQAFNGLLRQLNQHLL